MTEATAERAVRTSSLALPTARTQLLNGYRQTFELADESMKKSSKVNNSKKFEPGEHIRVVPLYHPKPSISIDQLARARGEEQEGDLFDGKPHPALASARLSY